MLSRALPEHDCVIPWIVSSSYSVIYTSALRQQSTSCSKHWSPLQTAAMICSKEGNFTSLQVLMIFYSLCSTLGDRKCSFETRPPTRKPENHARHEAACSNSTPLLEIDLYSVSTFYNCLIEGISLCFTLSSNQIKSERSHSLSRIGWSRPWLRL